jgi:hypothetical protein
MKLVEQILKSYLPLSSEHVSIVSAFNSKKVCLIQVSCYLTLVFVCEMLTLKMESEFKSEILMVEPSILQYRL